MEKTYTALRVRRFLVYVLLVALSALSLMPFVILLINSTQIHSDLLKGFSFKVGKYFFTNLRNLFSNDNIPVVRALLNSILVSTLCAVFSTYFSAMTAYGLFNYRFKGRRTAFCFIMAVMMIPAQCGTLGFLRVIEKIHLNDNLLALIIPAIAAPVVFFYILQYMQSFVSQSLIEAARIDGCNEFRIFNTIILPVIKPALAVQMIFSFVSSWNNYFTPALVINSKMKKTIPIIIAQLRSADYSKFDLAQVYMLICIAIVPLLIVYFVLSRHIISGVTLGSVKE